MSARTSVSGSPDESMPSIRGNGSKMIFRRFGIWSSTRAVRLIVPKGISVRSSGQVALASATLSPGSAICTNTPSRIGPRARRSPISSKRKLADFAAASSLERYSVPPAGLMRNRPWRLTPTALVNLNDATAKNASRAKLVGIGFGASTNRCAFG